MSQKAVNKKSFYGSMASGGSPDIAMPPLDEIPAIEKVSPDTQTRYQQQPDALFPVPENLPQDTIEELESSSTRNQSTPTDQLLNEQSSNDEEVEEVEEQVQPVKKSPQDSFKAVREAKEKAERERDAYMKHAMEIEMRYKSQEQQQQQVAKKFEIEQEEPEIDLNLDEDSLVDGRHLKGVSNKIKRLEEKLKQYEAQSEASNVEAKIRQQFPDFESVVSSENVKKLNQEYPEMAEMLANTGDIYKKASAAYSVMKKFGIYKSIYSEDKAKALINAAKPRPLASMSPQQGDSPLSKANAFANGLTNELKAQMQKEMADARKVM